MMVEKIEDNNFRLVKIANRIQKIWKIVDNLKVELPKKIVIEIKETLAQDMNIISVLKGAEGFILSDTDIEVVYKGRNTANKINLIYCATKNVVLKNCRITFKSDSQVNFTAVYNNGGLNTMLETNADGLSVENCRFEIKSSPNDYLYENRICGIENILANSVSIHGNHIFVQGRGNGSGQKIFGITNSGRYCRIENNNIKANGSHNKGRLKEAAYTFGVYNEGQYLIFNGNNCVGEWGGKCVGLQNNSQFCNITGNKILATHTICGRSVVLEGEKNIVSSNVITGTSRNPRMIELKGSYNTLLGNYIEVLQPAKILKSGCGIWIEGTSGSIIKQCVITNNTIVHTLDYGIYINYAEQLFIRGNQFKNHIETNEFLAILENNCSNNVFEGNGLDGNVGAINKDIYGKLHQNSDIAIKSMDSNDPN